jgi:hypothetical protein
VRPAEVPAGGPNAPEIEAGSVNGRDIIGESALVLLIRERLARQGTSEMIAA